MKYDDSANFLFSLAKRARKYYLGMTTITQDVEDFMGSKMGRAIVANASMQMLLKQSTSAVDVLAEVFKLTDEEKKRLAQFPVGQGLFFAGANHVHVQVIASPTETGLLPLIRNNSSSCRRCIRMAVTTRRQLCHRQRRKIPCLRQLMILILRDRLNKGVTYGR